MKKIGTAFLFCVLLFVSCLRATIYEVQHFEELALHVNGSESGQPDTKTLVLLDIDDTLLIPIQTLGTDVWFIYRHNKYKEAGLSQKVALEKALAEWEGIRHLTKVKLVEEGTDVIVRQLQDAGVCVMGLTTQGLALATRTVLQLESLGIDLARTSPSQEDCYFMNGHGVLYRQGILFTSGTPKGKALLTLLDKIGFRPDRVIFINDKQTHLKDVSDALEAENIPFAGLRYGFSDARVASFDPQIADTQFAPFTSILSDDEAKAVNLCPKS